MAVYRAWVWAYDECLTGRLRRHPLGVVSGQVPAAPARDHARAYSIRSLAQIAVAELDHRPPTGSPIEIPARDVLALATSSLAGGLSATAAAMMPPVDPLRQDVIADPDFLTSDDEAPECRPLAV